MTVYLVGLESHEQRYTGQWGRLLPAQLRRHLKLSRADETVRIVRGKAGKQIPTIGAFLNFASTNTFKGAQIGNIAKLFEQGDAKAGDVFLFTDAWHYGVTAVRYMSDLLDIPVKIVALWHAGQYDPHDFLGRIPDRTWAEHFEKSVFAACDLNVFATDFHIRMFKEAHGIVSDDKILRAGWPMEYMPKTLAPFARIAKRKLVLFPHRIAPEKQVDIFRDLGTEFPDYEFRVCQDQALTKDEYHRLLGEAVAVFSASLQETLGIGLYEGLVCGAMPIAPNRLSYTEMYPGDLLYPSDWTHDWGVYQRSKQQLVAFLRDTFEKAQTAEWAAEAARLGRSVGDRYFSGQSLYENLR